MAIIQVVMIVGSILLKSKINRIFTTTYGVLLILLAILAGSTSSSAGYGLSALYGLIEAISTILII